MALHLGLGLVAVGAVIGSAGMKVLTSNKAKKAYVHSVAAGLRAKDCVMEKVTCVQEGTADIVEHAKHINRDKAQKKESEVKVEEDTIIIEDTSEESVK